MVTPTSQPSSVPNVGVLIRFGGRAKLAGGNGHRPESSISSHARNSLLYIHFEGLRLVHQVKFELKRVDLFANHLVISGVLLKMCVRMTTLSPDGHM